MTTTRARWATGIAEVLGIVGRTVRVRCPHCGGCHDHSRSMLGSRSVVAGCHAGHTRLREYTVIDTRRPGMA